MNLRDRLEMAGQSLLALLDPEKEFMPVGGWEVAHDLGRWWDAVLRLEEAVDFIIPAELEAASLRNLQLLTDNPDSLLMNVPGVPWLEDKVRINPHNLRETLLTFGGLVRRRQSEWARECGLQFVRAIDECLQPDGSLDYTRLGSWEQAPFTADPSHTESKRDGWFDGTATSGRCLEALVWFYEATGEPLVLEVAQRVAEHHLATTINLDGTMREEIVAPENVGHNHSYHGTLRGMLLFGLLTEQRIYVDAVEATYRKAVRGQLVKESGWAPHDLGKDRFPNEHGDPVSDPASTGDAAQIALWLSLRAGCFDLLDDVERYVRARLLPLQLTPEDAERHPERNFTARELGAWPIHGPTHAGKGCTPDVLAAVTHSLCDIYQHIYTQTATGVRVNLHFDYEDEAISIRSCRAEQGNLAIQMKRPGDLQIRIPQWAPESSLRLQIDGDACPISRLGHFAWVPRDVLNHQSEVVLTYGLPERSSQEQMPSGRCYSFRWRGDEIVGIHPQDYPLPFYPVAERMDE